MPGDELSNRVSAYLKVKGGTKASAIAKALGVTRKEVNQLLYHDSGATFESVGSDPPLWYLSGATPTSSSISRRNLVPRRVSDVIEQSGIESKRIAQSVFVDREVLDRMKVTLRYANLEIEIDLVERGLSDPYVTYEMESPEKMNLIVNVNSVAKSTLDSAQSLFQHLLHCAADAISLRTMEESQSLLEREDVFSIKSRVLLDLATRGVTT